MKIAFLTNAAKASGVGHYAFALRQALQAYADVKITEYKLQKGGVLVNDAPLLTLPAWPGWLGSKSVSWLRGGLKLKKRFASFDIIHATNQTLSWLRLPGKPFVVTVHDIIELLEPQDKKAAFLNKYLLSGIGKADHLIAVSEYTKKSIQDYYHVPGTNISVIHNGIDGQVFYPLPDFANTIGYQTLRQDLKLKDQHPIVLYVGSEHPRKNVGVALQAFAQLKAKRPDALFIKVGLPGMAAGRVETLRVADTLGIRAAVRFIGKVSSRRLNELYNLADVFIYPSRLEGFGLPVLEAMAAGTPVVCSNASSLPEIAGEAAVMHAPDDVDGFAGSLLAITADADKREQMRQAGFAQAKRFNWEAAAQKTYGVYKTLLGE
jgi:glycosyltransferase involved in cell wall biosynthesis